jgi:hypothetical protein
MPVYREVYVEKDEPVSVAYGDSKGEERAELPPRRSQANALRKTV